MSVLGENGAPMLTMPVEPAYGGGNNNNSGWGDNGAWWIILFLIWGMWGGGWNNGGFGGSGNSAAQGALTREQACIDNNFNNLMRETAGIADSVNLGFANLNSTICNQQYETAGLINGLSNTVQSGFNAQNIAALQTANAQNIAAMQNANAIQAQLSQCCCDQRAATENVRFTIAQEDCQTRNLIQSTTRDMIDNNNANTRAILDKLTAQELAAKDAQITAQTQKIFGLELTASQAAQNNYLINQLRPTPVPCYPASSPCGYNWSPNVLAGGFGYNNGCGGCNC